MQTRAIDAAADRKPDKSAARISGMFDAIARRYDLLNRVLSGGLDRYWRWRAVRALRFSGRERVVDICTGTADVAIASLRGRARYVLGVDFAHEMLRIGVAKLRAAGLSGRAPLVRGDAMILPVADRSADAVTVAFGIRNVADMPAAFAEMARVLRPGGRLAILEFSMPSTPVLGRLYRWYFRAVLPRIGRLVSRHNEAYSYLPASVVAFMSNEELSSLLAAAGFERIHAVPLTFGVVYLYTAERP